MMNVVLCWFVVTVVVVEVVEIAWAAFSFSRGVLVVVVVAVS